MLDPVILASKEKKTMAAYIIAIVIMIIVLIAAIVFLSRTDQEAGEATRSVDFFIIPAVPIAELITSPDALSGEYAVQDEDGIIYYTIATSETLSLYAMDAEGETYERWSTTREEGDMRLEVVGVDDSVVAFIFTQETEIACEDLWSDRYAYYGISLGTTSYSGAAGLLYEQDEELLDNMKNACP